MKKLVLILIALPLLTFASEPEIYNYQIKGMHCSDCVESVKKSVCGMNGIEKCDVSIGQMTLQAASGKKLDQKSIAKAVKDAGHYSIQSIEKTVTKK